MLTSAGYDPPGSRSSTADPQEEREDIRRRFNADPAEHPVRVLLATDAAGEGIDLQRHCHRLVNFDVPFNPNRLEQRIGRIDRYGQTRRPSPGTSRPTAAATSALARDMDLLRRLADKMQSVRADLGRRTRSWLRTSNGSCSAAALARGLPRDASQKAVNEMLAGERRFSGDLTRIADELGAARDRPPPAPDQRPTGGGHGSGPARTSRCCLEVAMTAPMRASPRCPAASVRAGSSRRSDLDDPLTGKRSESISFDPEVVADGQDGPRPRPPRSPPGPAGHPGAAAGAVATHAVDLPGDGCRRSRPRGLFRRGGRAPRSRRGSGSACTRRCSSPGHASAATGARRGVVRRAAGRDPGRGPTCPVPCGGAAAVVQRWNSDAEDATACGPG